MTSESKNNNSASDIFVRYLEALENGEKNPEAILHESPELTPELQKKLRAYRLMQRAFTVISDRAAPHMGIPWENISLEGKKFGEFEIVREIGRGGMGSVYLAKQVSLNRLVAIKILPAHVTANTRVLQRFLQEARGMAKLRHPNIVTVHLIGEHEGLHFIVMDYVKGVGLGMILSALKEKGLVSPRGKDFCDVLGDLLESREGMLKVSPSEMTSSYPAVVCRIMIQIAKALQHAHENGIIHRDIKPSNILIDENGNALLIDFGLNLERGSQALTLSSELLGSPYYIAPEQIEASKDSAPELIDVYGMGVTLYEALVFVPPFMGDTVAMTLKKILRNEPALPRTLNSDIPRDLEAITLKAMEKEPGLRYANPSDFADDLDRFLDYKPVRAKPSSMVTRTWRRARRRPAATITAIFVLFLIIVMSWQGLIAYYGNRANDYAESKHYPEAVEAMRRAFHMEPTQSNHDDLAFYRLKAGQYQESANDYRAMVASNPSNPENHVNWGLSLWEIGKHNQAISEIKRGISLGAKETENYNNLAVFLLAEHRQREAIDFFERAVRENPGNTDLARLLAIAQQSPQTKLTQK